jgi:hypothetical protein
MIGTGFRSLTLAPPELGFDGPLRGTHLLAPSVFEQQPAAGERTPNPILLVH